MPSIIASSRWLFAVLMIVACTGISGCARKETVIDVETPAREVEVERNIDTGEVDVEVNKK